MSTSFEFMNTDSHFHVNSQRAAIFNDIHRILYRSLNQNKNQKKKRKPFFCTFARFGIVHIKSHANYDENASRASKTN